MKIINIQNSPSCSWELWRGTIRHKISLPKAAVWILWILSYLCGMNPLPLSFYKMEKTLLFFPNIKVSYFTIHKESTTCFLKLQFRSLHIKLKGEGDKELKRFQKEDYFIQHYNASQCMRAMVVMWHFCTPLKESFLPSCTCVSEGMAKCTMEECWKTFSKTWVWLCTEVKKKACISVRTSWDFILSC